MSKSAICSICNHPITLPQFSPPRRTSPLDDQGVLRVRDSDRTPSRAGVILLCPSAQFGKEWNHEPTVSAKSWRKAGGDGRHEGCRTARARARCRKPPKWPRTTTHGRHRPVNISAIWAQNIPNKKKSWDTPKTWPPRRILRHQKRDICTILQVSDQKRQRDRAPDTTSSSCSILCALDKK